MRQVRSSSDERQRGIAILTSDHSAGDNRAGRRLMGGVKPSSESIRQGGFMDTFGLTAIQPVRAHPCLGVRVRLARLKASAVLVAALSAGLFYSAPSFGQ